MKHKDNNGIYSKLINSKNNNIKLIPIEWAEEIRDNAQLIEMENEKILNKLKNNFYFNLLKEFKNGWTELTNTGNSERVDSIINKIENMTEL